MLKDASSMVLSKRQAAIMVMVITIMVIIMIAIKAID